MIPHTCIVKGDAHFLSIAAASVLAKTYRDDLMAQLAETFPEYGWEHNVGYPTPYHRRAIKLHGSTPYHRMSFRLIKE
jgi:ribonuclease HII